MPIVLVDQFLEFAWELADQVVVLERGTAVMSGARRDVDPREAAGLVPVQVGQAALGASGATSANRRVPCASR